MGTSFAESRFKKSAFENCNVRYANFDRAALRGCKVSDGNFANTVFTECILKDMTLSDTDFSQASFFQTPLRGLDLTTCRIDGIALSESSEEIRGAIVSTLQALMLASRLGIVIKE